MIRMMIAAALAATVITGVTLVPPSTGLTETIERPRGLKGDRLPLRAPGVGCADARWPAHQDECIVGRAPPAGQTPAMRQMRTVAAEPTPADGSSPIANAQRS